MCYRVFCKDGWGWPLCFKKWNYRRHTDWNLSLSLRPTIAGAAVEPVADIKWAGFACNGGRHRLVRVVLVLWEENIQGRRFDNLSWMLWVLGGGPEEKWRKRNVWNTAHHPTAWAQIDGQSGFPIINVHVFEWIQQELFFDLNTDRSLTQLLIQCC